MIIFSKKYRGHSLSLTGFTLLELIVTVIIIGILAAIAMPMYTNARDQRRGEAVINNIRLIIAAEKIYNIKNGGYWPPSGSGSITVSDNEINTNLNISIIERYFIWGTKNFYLRKLITPYFEIRTRSGWASPTYYICVNWNTNTDEINWTYEPVGSNHWFGRFPNSIPEDNNPDA